jgi:hypothetical protein
LTKSNIYRKLRERFDSYDDGFEIFLNSAGIFLLFWLSVITVYVFPIGLDKLFFAILFLIFWYSESNYFWFAFFLIINFSPGSFFTETSGEAVRRLTIYTLFPKASFSVLDIFTIISLIKAIVRGRKFKIKDVLNIRYASVFLIYIAIVTLFHGISIQVFIRLPLRGLLFYSFFYSFPALVYLKKDTYKFMYMFFPFVFNELISQVFLIITNQYLLSVVYKDAFSYVIKDKLMGDTVRAIANGYPIIILSYIFSFVLLERDTNYSSKWYLYLIIAMAGMSIMFSATRQTIIMFAFIFILYFVYVNKSKPGVALQLFFFTALFFFFLDIFNFIDLNKIFGASLNRFTGAVYYQAGTIEAEDTLDYRISVRLPLILQNVQRSLFLGFGFSDRYFEYHDGHLGGILVGIMQMGLLGYSALVFFIYSIFKKSIIFARKLGNGNSNTKSIKAIIVGMSGYVLVNIFIDPAIVFNYWARPQEFFILLVLLSQFIKFGKMEYYVKYKEKMTGNKIKKKDLIPAVTA